MELENYSAYHGKNWQERIASHSKERGACNLWRTSYGSDSEYSPLQEVVLFSVTNRYPKVSDPDQFQFLAPVSPEKMQRELDSLASTYKNLGIKVHYIFDDQFEKVSPNLVFCRDLFFLSPHGAILGRMASTVRAGEEKWAQLALAKEGIPILKTISGTGLFEGADALWLTPKHLLIGVGNRTNREGFEQVRNVMQEFGVECFAIPLVKSVQHLLGLLQLAAPRKALVRSEKAPAQLLEILQRFHYQVIHFQENTEIQRQQAFNFVCIAENRVLMAKNCPDTKAKLESNEIEVVAETEISQLIAAAGGIACATGILARKLRFSEI